jgi:hypothetical protein
MKNKLNLGCGKVILNIILFTIMISFIIPNATATISTAGRQYYFNFTDNMKNEWKPENAWNCTGVSFAGQGADFEASESDYCEYTVDKTLISALADYTFCLKIRPESVSAAMYIWDEFGSNYGNLYRIRDPGSGFYKFNSRHNADNTDTTTTIAANTNYTTCTIWKDTSNTGELLLNNANESALDTQYTASDDTYQIEIGAIKENFGARSGFYDGIIYEMCIWNRSLTAAELTEFHTYGCEGSIEAPPPTNQTPTPTGLTNVSLGLTNITISWNGNYGSKYLIYRNGTNVANDTVSPYLDTGLTNHTRYGYQVQAYNVSYTTPLSALSTKFEVFTKQTIQAIPSVNTTLYSPLNMSVNQSIDANFSIGLISSITTPYTIKFYQRLKNLSFDTGATLGYSVSYDPLNKSVWMGNWSDTEIHTIWLDEYDAYTLERKPGRIVKPAETEDCAYDQFRNLFVCIHNPNGTILRSNRAGTPIDVLNIGVAASKQGIDVNSDGNYTVCVDTQRYKFDSDTGAQISTGSISGGCSCDGLTVRYDAQGKDESYWLSCDGFGVVVYNTNWAATGYQIPTPDARGIEGLDFHENQCTLYITFDDHAPGVSNGFYVRNICDPLIMNVTQSVSSGVESRFNNLWDDLLYETVYRWYYRYNSSYASATSGLYNFSTAAYYVAPQLTLNTPIINYENYTTNPFVFRFNGTATDLTNYSFYCKLWAPYNTKTITDKWVTDIRTNQNITFDTSGYESPFGSTGYLRLNLTCQNNEIALEMLNRAIWLDSDNPTITRNAGLNNSVYYRGVNTVLPYIFTYSDDNLYVTNTTLCASSSGTTCTQQISNWVSTSLTDDSRVVNVTNPLSGLPEAYNRYYIYLQAWDGHTANEITDYDLKDISTGLKQGVKINDKIEISSPDAKSLTFVKDVDRYSFDLDLKEPTDKEIIFYLKSTGNLTYNPHSEYLGHFIDFENRKWIDFESQNAESFDYVKVSDKEYQIIIKLKPTKKGETREAITFNSIGDLNYVNAYYYFNISQSQTFKASDLITGLPIQNITVKVYTYPNTLIQQKSTTAYNVSFNISGTYYFNLSGNIGGVNYVTNVTANYPFVSNNTKTVYLATTNSFYIIFKDESTLLNMTGTNVYLDIISDSYSSNYSSNVGWLYLDDLASGEYTFRYGATGYHNRLSSFTLTQDTFNRIDLYLLTGGSSNITLYVLDSTRQPVESAEIHVYRYSVTDNAYIQVNTINTDYEGKAIIDAQKNAEFYRFYIYYNNDLKLSTQPAYITSSEMVFTIGLTDPILDQYFKNEVDYTYSCEYNIYTRNFKFYYDTNSEASRGCLDIYKITPQTNTLYNSTCVSSGSSTILSTIANTTWTTYTARGYITVDGIDYILCTNSYNFGNTVFNKGFGSFFIILFVILFAFVGFYSLPLAFVLSPIPLVIGSGLGLIQIPMSASIGMFVLGVSLAVIIQKRVV